MNLMPLALRHFSCLARAACQSPFQTFGADFFCLRHKMGASHWFEVSQEFPRENKS